MSKKTQLILSILCALMILCLPLLVPSGSLLETADERLNEASDAREDDEYPEEGWLDFLFGRAHAEETPARKLPIDFTSGMQPNPACYTEDGYQDDSITVKMEMRDEGHVTYCVAYVTIADASQFRTGVASLTSKGAPGKREAQLSSMVGKYNAIVAISADLYTNNPDKTTYETRMGVNIRHKKNSKKSALFIDENGDFHMIERLTDVAAAEKSVTSQGHQIINAFTFGPILVADGVVQKMDSGYGYNPGGREPRMAIGQTGKLSYVLVMAEGRGKESDGVTHQELADFMGELGCVQAFNLDGGNTAEMLFNGKFYGFRTGNERPQSDFIYFATAVDPTEWQ